MNHKPASRTQRIFLFTLLLSLLLAGVNSRVRSSAYATVPSAPEAPADHQHKIKDDEKGKHKDNHDSDSASASHAPTTIGKPTIREDRGDISALDLTLGIGSVEGMPKAPFQFVKEDQTGTNPKIK